MAPTQRLVPVGDCRCRRGAKAVVGTFFSPTRGRSAGSAAFSVGRIPRLLARYDLGPKGENPGPGGPAAARWRPQDVSSGVCG